jgi:hypothetical protein
VKRRAFVILAIIVGSALLTDAKSTKLIFTWLNPKYPGTHFKNVMVLGINGRASVRAQFEDQLCAGIARPGIQCSPSYSLVPRPTGTPLDINDLRDVVSGQNIDAIVASRLVKIDKTVTYIPGQAYPMFPVYGTFYGYYGAIYPVVYSPDYLRVDRTAQVETNFYSTAALDGELVCTGTSDTVNPQSPNKAIDALSKLIVQELQKQNII